MIVTKWAQLRGEIVRTRNPALMQIYSSALQRQAMELIESGTAAPAAIAAALELNFARVRRLLEYLRRQNIIDDKQRICGNPESVEFEECSHSLGAILERFADPATVLEQITIESRPELAELQRQVLITIHRNGGEWNWLPAALTNRIYENGFPTLEFEVQCALLALVDDHLLFERLEPSAGRRAGKRANWSLNWSAIAQRIPSKNAWLARRMLPMKRVAIEQRNRKQALEDFAAVSAEQLLERISYSTGLTHRKTQLRLLRLIDRDGGMNPLTLKELCDLEECDGPKINQKTAALAIREFVAGDLVDEHELGFRRFRWIRWSVISERLQLAVLEQARALPPETYPAKPKRAVGNKTTQSAADLFGPVVVGGWGDATAKAIAKQKKAPTLAAIAEKYVYPQLKLRKRKRATITSLKRSVRKWEAYFPEELWNIRNIRTKHIESWQQHLRKKLAAATVNIGVRNISQILRAGERHRIIKRVPVAQMLVAKPAGKQYFRPEQVEQLWQAASKVNWPRINGITSGEFWKCAIVLYWTYGFRTQELISFMESERPGLKWSNVSFAAETPNPDGTAFNAAGWLTYTPLKQSWAKPTPLYLPLTESARAAFEVMQNARSPGNDRVFPLTINPRRFYAAWRSLQEFAGVRLKDGGLFKLKAFRRSAATYLENHHRGLGAAVCGWADRDVSSVMAKHYQVTEDMLVEQLAAYKLPGCFAALKPLSVSAETA
jgi:hypothetical protein